MLSIVDLADYFIFERFFYNLQQELPRWFVAGYSMLFSTNSLGIWVHTANWLTQKCLCVQWSQRGLKCRDLVTLSTFIWIFMIRENYWKMCEFISYPKICGIMAWDWIFAPDTLPTTLPNSLEIYYTHFVVFQVSALQISTHIPNFE